jgi:GAF domain-containing protein
MGDKHKTKEQLIDELKQMRLRIVDLETSKAGRKLTEEALRERIKELNCLYSIADIIEKTDTMEEIFRKTADLIQNSWYYPEFACARITYKDQEFKTGNFQETAWKISADIITHSKPVGMVEVRYLKEMPDKDEGPFLKEERDLINAVAERLGRVADRKLAEMEVKLNEKRLAGLLRITQYRVETVQELLDFALDESISLTDSKIGYIYFYNDEKREFTLNTWSKDVMKECTIQEKKTCYSLDKTGVWGEAVRQARPIIINDFTAPDPLKKGYPEGHAHLYKFLTIPVLSNDRIVAVLGVANKETDYDESDIRQLTLLMNSVWQITERKRMGQERENLIHELKEALSKVKALSGLLPICASCKKIRNDKGYWEQMEIYIRDHSEAEFSHGICPECMKKLYPEYYEKNE